MNMDQEFDSIYQKIYDASYSRLAEVKDKNRKFLGIFCLCLIILNFIIYLIPQTKYLSVITAGISLCVLVFFPVPGAPYTILFIPGSIGKTSLLVDDD